MSVVISGVEQGSIAQKLGILPGQVLQRIDGHEIEDVLDYRFYMTAKALTLHITDADGAVRELPVKKGEYEEIGLLFDTYLMDKQRHCKNKCIFCFIDQLPKGMRESLYFKDDDDRMSFLFGNYITLTNLREKDVRRILDMHISPVNISVHTTNPELRVKMMGNPHAGEVLRWLLMLAEGGIRLNAQLVLCPGINDGPELERSLTDLCALAPNIESVAVVPVGLTNHRQGLAELRPFTSSEAANVIDTIDVFGDRMKQEYDRRICYSADEFYLLAGRPVPSAEFYGPFSQLENGVGLWSLLRQEFYEALEDLRGDVKGKAVTVVTGKAALPLIEELMAAACDHIPGLQARVIGIENDFFGRRITVAGLVTGGDLLAQLREYDFSGTDELLIPGVMLRHEGDLFLDGMSVEELSAALELPVTPVPNDGYQLLENLLKG